MKLVIRTLILIMLSSPVYAQGFLKKLGDKTMNKIQKKAEDKLVDELSEKLANAAVKPINNYMDSLFAESYEQETGEAYDPANAEKMSAFLEGMMAKVELPESYNFDYTLEVEVRDFGSKKEETMYMLVSTSQDIFGMQQKQDGKDMLIVFDNENSAMVSYNQDTKEVMALPVNSALMGAFAERAMEEEAKEKDLKVTRLNKSKKVLGYASEGYRFESSDSESEVYISKSLPFSWEDSFGTMLRQFAPNFYKENEEYQIDGMMMEAETERKEDGKTSSWKMKKIEDKDYTINNADYSRMQYGQN